MCRKRAWKMPLRGPVSAQLGDGVPSFHSKLKSRGICFATITVLAHDESAW
ncbi:MAG: hypothetical protein HFG49_07175 [Lachnospiraceae bacterium]|nr:hypothetical protein [Lachnospiraceae bacterium]